MLPHTYFIHTSSVCSGCVIEVRVTFDRIYRLNQAKHVMCAWLHNFDCVCLCFGHCSYSGGGCRVTDFKLKNTQRPQEGLNPAVLWTPSLRRTLMCCVFCKLFMPQGDESVTFYKFFKWIVFATVKCIFSLASFQVFKLSIRKSFFFSLSFRL